MAVQCAAETEVAPQDRFDYFWNQRGEWVEEPNVRRGGESGVQRVMGSDGQLLYVKRQTGHIHRSLQHPFGRPTVMREHAALIGVTELGVAINDRVLKDLAENLARMHKGRWQHGCLYDKHVFVRVTGEGESAKVEVALIDLEKCRRRLTAYRAAVHDLKQLRRHSSFSAADWQKFIYFYETAFGSAIKGL